MEPTLRDVQANGLRHRVLEWDGGGSTTVLCLHGFLDSAWAFFEVAPRLATAGFHVVAPDLRGHGDTDRVGAGGQYHFMDYVLDLADLAEALSRGRLALVGHSMGASVACYFAGAFPARAWRAALLEGPLHFQEPPDPPVARLAAWVDAVHRARARGPRTLPSLEAAAGRIRDLDPRCPPETALALAARTTRPVEGGVAFKHDPLHLTPSPYPFQVARALPFWRALRCPLLLLDAADTELPAPPDFAERLAAFRGARRVLVPEAGHMLMRHQPARVAAELAAFLA
jgi:pimeloyl-ACP methyl ester carboxylesterase